MFNAVVSFFSLPLFAKDLVEKAHRKRTYLWRVLYALFLFALVCWSLSFIYSFSDDLTAQSLIGQGRPVLMTLLYCQLIGIYAFLPTVTAGAVTGEKQRGTWVLVGLTMMGPWRLVLQKFLSVAWVFFGLLLLSLPVMALAMSWGGVSWPQLVWISFMLVMVMLQVTAFGTLATVWARSVGGAYIFTLLLIIGWYLIGSLLLVAVLGLLNSIAPAMGTRLLDVVTAWVGCGDYTVVSSMISCWLLISVDNDLQSGSPMNWYGIGLLLMPTMVSIVLPLVLSRWALYPRMDLQPGRTLNRRVFDLLDRLFRRRVKGGAGPRIGRPILWREMNRLYIARLRHLVWFFGLIALSLFCGTVIALIGGLGEMEMVLFWYHLMLVVGWLVVLVMVLVRSADSFVRESSHQTLDVLLVCPVTNSRLVFDKWLACWLYGLVMSVAILLIQILRIGISWLSGPYDEITPVVLLWTLGHCVVYTALMAGLGMCVGLLMRGRTSAVVVAVVVLIAWILLPWLAILPLIGRFMFSDGGDWLVYLFLSSPISGLFLQEAYSFERAGEVFGNALIVNLLGYTAISAGLCLTATSIASRRLKRVA